MSKPILRDANGVYHWKGESFVSVTTALGALAKPAIAPWAAKCVAEYANELLDRGREERWNYERLREELAVEKIKGAPWSKRDTKADLGTVIHDIAEKWALGQRLSIEVFSPEIQPYMRTLYRFLETEQVEFIAAEATVFSRAFGYAGTLDGICKIGDRVMLMDYKTSTDSYPEHCLQMAAYRHADFIGIAETGDELEIPATDGAMIVLVQPDIYTKVEWPAGEAEFGIFLSILNVAQWQRNKPKPLSKNKSKEAA